MAGDPMALSPLANSTNKLADAAYASIMAGLLDGSLKPGDRLVMDRLAAELGISRTPVRDALQRLEQDGVIAASPPRGYVVRSVGNAEIAAIYQAREAVEGYAARIVAGLGAAAYNTISAAIDATADLDTSTPSGSFEANRSIHRAIVAAIGNPYLVRLFDDIWGKSAAALTYAELFGNESEHPDVRADHQSLLAALRSGNPATAEQEALTHIREGMARNLG
jgi:DNA-binding GntR family transcriptional regulator